MTQEIRVGSAERSVLTAMGARGGSWSTDDPPLWDTRYWTLRLLYSLVRKDLVKEVVPDQQYELTKSGMRSSLELGHPVVITPAVAPWTRRK